MARIVLDEMDRVYPGGVKGIDGLGQAITDEDDDLSIAFDPGTGLAIGQPVPA